MTYGIQPWQMMDLRRSEWLAICTDHEARQRAAREGV